MFIFFMFSKDSLLTTLRYAAHLFKVLCYFNVFQDSFIPKKTFRHTILCWSIIKTFHLTYKFNLTH